MKPILKRVRELVIRGWCKFCFAKINGVTTACCEDGKYPDQFCIIGAISRACYEQHLPQDAAKDVVAFVKSVGELKTSLQVYNDSQGVTAEHIVDLLDKCIERVTNAQK